LSHIIALSGGVGGAKLAFGLAEVLAPDDLTIVANTADDFDHLGLPICPDIDTLVYTLAGVNDAEKGWGRAAETWSFMAALGDLGGDTWFQLGDKDIAMHVLRRSMLEAGKPLSGVCAHVCKALNIPHAVVPMSDARMRTIVETAHGDMAFQHYFVKHRCEPAVKGFRFDGVQHATPSPAFERALGRDDLGGIILCPSNPFVSIGPILALDQLRRRLGQLRVPVIAVSPIVGGQALKGPTAKMMAELGMPQSAGQVARLYADFLDGFVVDLVDAAEAEAIASPSLHVESTQTVMRTDDDKRKLALACLGFIDRLRSAGGGNAGQAADPAAV